MPPSPRPLAQSASGAPRRFHRCRGAGRTASGRQRKHMLLCAPFEFTLPPTVLMTDRSSLIAKGLLLARAFVFPSISFAAVISATDAGFEVLETVFGAGVPKEAYAT